MKTSQLQPARSIQLIFLPPQKSLTILLTFLLFCFYNSGVLAQRPDSRQNIVPPHWAPAYEHPDKVHYYYIPDIECYYDVWNNEYAYLEDGSWMFGAALPAVYSWLDLNTAFVVVLDNNVYQPWLHFNYYVSHYPRYYYRSFYKKEFEDNKHSLRGFNENQRSVVYGNPSPNPGNNHNEGLRERRDFPDRRVAETHPPQRMEYNSKDVGQPVKVTKNMRRPQDNKKNHN